MSNFKKNLIVRAYLCFFVFYIKATGIILACELKFHSEPLNLSIVYTTRCPARSFMTTRHVQVNASIGSPQKDGFFWFLLNKPSPNLSPNPFVFIVFLRCEVVPLST